MINLYELRNTEVPLDNHYQLIERIGGGGFSEVWLAKDLRSQVQVALKVYSSVQEMDEEGIGMFRKEFSLVCNLNHTNILKPFTFDIYNGCPYIVLPYCEKGSMAQYVGKLQEDELWEFAGQVAAGLAYMHQHQIIHQDIKPGNVLINGDGQLMITDFGISTGVRKTMRRSKNSDDSARDGTIAYMSYECLRDNPVNVMARDIWALGASLYELAAGDVPFGDYGGLTQKAKGGGLPMSSLNVSADLKSLIRKCLSLEPWNRPSAEDVVNMVAAHRIGKQSRLNVSMANLPAKKIAMSTVGIATAVSAMIFIMGIIAGGHEPDKGDLVALTPNDSAFLRQITEASDAVNAEKSKASIEARDVENLCAAAETYKEAAGVEVTDSVKARGDSAWNVSQKVIDETYIFLHDRWTYYNDLQAFDAAGKFAPGVQKLKDYVSPATIEKIRKDSIAATKKNTERKPSKARSKRKSMKSTSIEGNSSHGIHEASPPITHSNSTSPIRTRPQMNKE